MEAGTLFSSEIGVTTMGKVILPDKQPGMLPRRTSPLLIAAAVLGSAVLALGGLLLVRAMRGPQAPLPFATSAQLPPLPDGAALPQAGQQQLPSGEPLPKLDQQAPPAGQPLPSTAQQPPPAGPPLPNTAQQPQQAQQPLTAVNPPSPAAGPPLPAVDQQPPPPSQPLPQAAQPPQPSGEVRWRWWLEPAKVDFAGLPLGEDYEGYALVALGVEVANMSTADAKVSFESGVWLHVDGRKYEADTWLSAFAIRAGLHLMAPCTLPPGSKPIRGYLGVFAIPRAYSRLLPEWYVGVPPGVRVVRIDPQ